MTRKQISRMYRQGLRARFEHLLKEREALFAENQKLWEKIKESEQVGEDCSRCWYILKDLLEVARAHMARLDVPRPKITRPSTR